MKALLRVMVLFRNETSKQINMKINKKNPYFVSTVVVHGLGLQDNILSQTIVLAFWGAT